MSKTRGEETRHRRGEETRSSTAEKAEVCGFSLSMELQWTMGTRRASVPLFPVIVLLFSARVSAAASAWNTISRGRPLSGDQTIVSQNGRFELGFFSPAASGKYYVGTWYKREPRETVVWVANREQPATNGSELAISGDGNLAITNLGVELWSSSVRMKKPVDSTSAVLRDDGNLVLADRTNPWDVLWQSFDDPTDTWLPGAWVGFDRARGRRWVLTSWRSPSDPAPGNHSFGIDDEGTVLRWREHAGPTRRADQACDLLDNATSGGITRTGLFSFSCSYGDSSYYSSYSVVDRSINARVTIDTSGGIGSWFQGSPGCSSPDTRRDAFYSVLVDGFPGSLFDFFESVGSEGCKQACLNNCSCIAYSYGDFCWTWSTAPWNRACQQPNCSGYTLNIRVAAAELRTPHIRRRNVRVVSVVAGCASLVLVAMAVLLRRLRLSHANRTYWKGRRGSLVSYPYKKLEGITNNFSEKLGKGGFGSVYKGTLPCSDVVAVKKLEGLGQGEKQFKMEVGTIGIIHHINLVRLRGCCAEGAKRLLVYDFMPNGSLDSHLFGKKVESTNSTTLDWNTRYQIALGTARGLAYLHKECRECIVHCDIKPENILLDARFCPKVADFGLAKLLGREFEQALTTMRGTVGYLAPEWIAGMPITEKADAYSFGMMLFEIISGKRNTEKSGEGEFVYFPLLAALKIQEDDLLCLVDHRLEGNVNMDELVRACRVACWCIQDFGFHRPSMPQVVRMLEGELQVEKPPIPKSLRNLIELESSTICSDPIPKSLWDLTAPGGSTTCSESI